MPELIIGSPDQRMLWVGSRGEVGVSGVVSIGNNPLIDNSAYEFLYITSGTATGVTGSAVGSIIQYIGLGSYTQVLTWSNNRVVTVGSSV